MARVLRPALAGGVRGVLSNQLYADGDVIGAMLATHAAGVMMAVNGRQEFESALASRDFIGQAKACS